MFLFSRLENAAKVESLFKSPSKPVKGPSPSTGGGSGDAGRGGGAAKKPEGAPSHTPGEKLPAPDPGTLESLFQGMVDPAVPDHKRKAGKADSDEAHSELKVDAHEGHDHDKDTAKDAAPGGAPAMAPPAPGVAPDGNAGKKKKKGDKDDAKYGKDAKDDSTEDKKKAGSRRDAKSNQVTDELQAQHKRHAGPGAKGAAAETKDHKAPGGGAEPSASTEIMPTLTGDFDDVRGENNPGGSGIHALFHGGGETERPAIYHDEGPSLAHGSFGDEAHHAKPPAKAKPLAAPNVAKVAAKAKPAVAKIDAKASPPIDVETDIDPFEELFGTDEDKGESLLDDVASESLFGTDEEAAAPNGVGVDAKHAKRGTDANGAKDAKGGVQSDDAEVTAAAAATLPAAVAAAVTGAASTGGKDQGDHKATKAATGAAAAPAAKGVAKAGPAPEHPAESKASAPGKTPPGVAPLHVDGGELPPIAARAPGAAAGVQQVSHEVGAGLAQAVTATHEAVSAVSDAPLADVGANQPVPTEHLRQEFQGGGGGGGGGAAHAQRHADPMSEAQQQMAELQHKADWKSEIVFNEQIAKAEQLGSTAEHKAQTIESYSAVEEEKAKAKQKKAEADAQKHVEDEKGKHEVTIESLKADLAASVETERQELTQQNEKGKTDVHAKFEQQRQKMLDKQKSDEARVAADIVAKKAQIDRDIAQQKKAMQDHIREQQDTIKQQAKQEEQTNTTTAETDAQAVIQTGDTEAAKTIKQGETEASELTAKGQTEAGAARQQGREKAAQARSEAAAKAAQLRSGGGGVLDSVKGFFGGGSEGQADDAISDGELRATMATDAAEETAKKIEDQAAASAGKAKADAQTSAEKAKGEAKKDAANLKKKAEGANKAVEQRVAESEAKAQGDAKAKGAEMDGEGQTMQTAAQAAADKAKVDDATSVATAIAKLATDETKALAKLEADLTKSLAGVQTKFDATEKKLESGKAGDIKSLEKMVGKAMSDIDHASVEAAKHVDSIRKDAERAAKADVAKALQQITMHTAAALSKIEGMARKAIGDIKASAEAASKMLDLDGQQGMTAVEREGAMQKAAIDAQATRDEKKISDDAGKDRDTIHAHTEKIVASFGEKNHELAGELDKVMTVDLTASKKAADDLNEAMEGWGTDEAGVYAALKSVGDDKIKMRAIKAAYKQKTGKDLDDDLEDEMDGTELRRAKAIESQDPVRVAVAELEDAKSGWGTDEEQIHKTLEDMKKLSADDQAKVSSDYRKMTGERLTTMLKDELSGEDLDKANAELAQLKQPEEKRVDVPAKDLPAIEKKVRKDVGELRKAFNGIGTDEAGVMKALEGKSKEEIQVIKDMYQKEYGESLEDRLEDELSGTDLKEATAKLSADPVQIAVSKMQNAADGWGTDEKKIHETLEGITDPEVRLQVAEEYEKQTGHSLKSMIADEMSGADKEIADTLLLPDNHERDIKVAAIKLDDAANGGFLGTGAGTDEDEIYKVLEKAGTQEERNEIAAAYLARTGKTLDTMLHDELSGAELDIATSLQSGDAMGASVARLKNAADGLGTDEKAIFKELGKYPDDPDHPENAAKRAELERLYDEKYGANADPPGLNLQDMLKDEMSDMDLTKAEELRKDGKVSDVTELEWAMDGVGTDEEAIKAVLQGKSKKDIKEITDKWNAAHDGKDGRPAGPSLDAALGDELSGRDGHEVEMMLKGKPETPAEMLEQAKENYEYERGSGSTGFSVGVMDVFSGDASADLDRDHAALVDLENKLKAEGKITTNDKGELIDVEGAKLSDEEKAKLEDKTEFQDLNVANYQAAKDGVTNVMAQVGMVVAGAVVTILTAGAAAPAIAAAEMAMEVAAETALEVAAEIALEAAAETAAEALVEVGTEAIIEVGAEALAEGATELAAEVATETAVETAAEGMVEEAVPALIEEAAPEIVEEAAVETAAEETAVEAAEETALETAGETAAEEGAEETAAQTAAKTLSKPMQKALSALAAGATNVTIKASMLGDAYGIEDMGIDIGKAILQAATAGLLETERLKSILSIAQSIGLDPQKLMGQVVNAAMMGGAGGALNSIGEVVFNDELWRSGDIGKELAIAIGKGALSGAVGGAIGHLQNSALEKVGFLGLNMGTPLTAGEAALKGIVTGSLGALTPMAVSGLWDPAIFEGRFEEVMQRFGMAGLTGAIQGGADGLNQFIDEPYQKARLAADKDANENPNSTPESQAKAAEEAFTEEINHRAAELAKRDGGASPAAEEHAEGAATKTKGVGLAKEEAPAQASPQAVEEGVAKAETEALPKVEEATRAQTEQVAKSEPQPEPAAAGPEGATAAPATTTTSIEEPPAGPVHDQAEATAVAVVSKAVEEAPQPPAIEETAAHKVAESAPAAVAIIDEHAAMPAAPAPEKPGSVALEEPHAAAPALEEATATPRPHEENVAKLAASPEAEEFLSRAKTPEQDKVLAQAEETIARAKAENDGIISVEDARRLQALAAEHGVPEELVPRASTPEDILRAKGMTDAELEAYKSSLGHDQQSTLTDEARRSGNVKDSAAQQSSGLERPELNDVQKAALLKANAILFDELQHGTMLAKVITEGQVGGMLAGETVSAEGKVQSSKMVGDMTMAATTEGLTAAEKVQNCGLDYYGRDGATGPYTEMKDGVVVVKESVKLQLFQIEQAATPAQVENAKVPMGPDLIAAALEHVKTLKDSGQPVPKIFEQDEATGKFLHIVERVRTNDIDPSAGFGYTASQTLRDEGGGQFFQPNQELNAGAQALAPGAKLAVIGADGERTHLATFDGTKFVPEPGLAPEHADLLAQKLEQQLKTNNANRAAATPAPAPPSAEPAAAAKLVEGTPAPVEHALTHPEAIEVAPPSAAAEVETKPLVASAEEKPQHAAGFGEAEPAQDTGGQSAVKDRIEAATGVDKGDAHAAEMQKLREFYAQQAIEAQDVSTVNHAYTDQMLDVPGAIPGKTTGFSGAPVTYPDGTPYGYEGHAGYDVREFSHGVTAVEVRVHLQGDATPADVERIKTQATANVDKQYNYSHDVTNTAGEASRLHVEVVFVDDPAQAHLSVNARHGEGHSVQNQWYADEAGVVYAHELGHQLGLKDEYADAKTVNRTSEASPGVSHDGSLMGNFYTTDPADPSKVIVDPSTSLKQRHLDQFSGEINAQRSADGHTLAPAAAPAPAEAAATAASTATAPESTLAAAVTPHADAEPGTLPKAPMPPEPDIGPPVLTDEQKQAMQAKIKTDKPLTPEKFLDPAMDQGHVQQLNDLIDKGYYFRGGELVAPPAGVHVVYDPERGFIEAPGRAPPETIKAGTTKDDAFKQLGGTRASEPASTDASAPAPGTSPLDRWVDAATEAIASTPKDKLDARVPGLSEKIDPKVLETTEAYKKARSGEPPLEHEAALEAARREAVIEHMLGGVKVDPETQGLPKELNEDTVRGHMKERIPLDAVIADLPFEQAKQIFDDMAPADKGNTFEAWETKQVKDEVRSKLLDDLRKNLPAGVVPSQEQLRAIETRVNEQVQTQVEIPNERSVAPEDLKKQAVRNLATTNPEKAGDPVAIAEEAARIGAQRAVDAREEAIGRLKEKVGEQPTEAQIQKEIAKLATQRQADLVLEPIDPLAKEEQGVKVKELKATGEGMNEHDELQSRDYLKAAASGEMVGDPPRPVREVAVKFADTNGAKGSARVLADLLDEGAGKFTFEIADAKTGKSQVIDRASFVEADGTPMTRKAIEEALKAGQFTDLDRFPGGRNEEGIAEEPKLQALAG